MINRTSGKPAVVNVVQLKSKTRTNFQWAITEDGKVSETRFDSRDSAWEAWRGHSAGARGAR